MSVDFTIASASALVAAGKLSPLELTKQCLARIDQFDAQVHAFTYLAAESALEAAAAAETAIAREGPLGPLHGIPIGIKDVIDVVGMPTTGNSRLRTKEEATADADTVARLRSAGAIIMGKLSSHELAFCGPSFDLPYPQARNPWDIRRFTGGSSTGSAAAVAAGFCLGAVGTDTSGSIRFPAALCGIAGLKASYGRVSLSGIIPLTYSLDHCGPMAWTAEDCSLMMSSLADGFRRDVADITDALGTLTGCRIGIPERFFVEPCSSAVLAAFRDSLDVLQSLGAQLVEVNPSPLEEYTACTTIILLAEAYSIHEDNFRVRGNSYGVQAQECLILGSLISASEYLVALRRRAELCAELDHILGAVEFIAMPTDFTTAPFLDGQYRLNMVESASPTAPFNLSGLPALTVCNGLSEDGLPIGLQIAGRLGDDARVLWLSQKFERAIAQNRKRPKL